MNFKASSKIPLLAILSLPLLAQVLLMAGLLSHIAGLVDPTNQVLIWELGIFLGTTSLLAIGIFYWLFHHVLRLNWASQEVAHGELSSPLRVSLVQELNSLTGSSNQVAQQLKESLQTQPVQGESGKKFAKIFHFNPDAIVIATLTEGRILEVNDSFCHMMDYSADEVVGKTLYEFNFWLDSHEQISISQRLKDTGTLYNCEFEFYTKSGELRAGLVSAEVIDLSGQECILAAIKDATKFKQREQALQESEKRYRSIFENSVEGIFQSSLDGRFIIVNPALARLYGYDSPEDLMTNVTNISKQIYVQPKRRAELIAYMQMFDVVSDFESQVFRKDGSTIWVSENIRAVRDDKGTLLYFEGTAQDISERRQVEEELRQQRLRAERLLLNILPQTIAERLKRNQLTIASRFDQVTVMFADLVDFTRLSARTPPTDLVKLLGKIFSEFDNLVEQHRLEKIKTIGDAYMVAGGLPLPSPNSASAIAEMALDMQHAISYILSDTGEPFRLRIGINSGPIVAGVIGTKKFSYDLWGDTVNVASRMESQGLPGKIQVTEATYRLLKDRYILEERGPIFVKGKGEMTTYWLVGRKEVGGVLS